MNVKLPPIPFDGSNFRSGHSDAELYEFWCEIHRRGLDAKWVEWHKTRNNCKSDIEKIDFDIINSDEYHNSQIGILNFASSIYIEMGKIDGEKIRFGANYDAKEAERHIVISDYLFTDLILYYWNNLRKLDGLGGCNA